MPNVWDRLQQFIQTPEGNAYLQSFGGQLAQAGQWQATPVSGPGAVSQAMTAGQAGVKQYGDDQWGQMQRGLEMMKAQDEQRKMQAQQMLATMDPSDPNYRQVLAQAYPEQFGGAAAKSIFEKPDQPKDPTSYREWELAGKPGTYADWLASQKPGMSLSYDAEGRPIIQQGPAGTLGTAATNKAQKDVLSAVDQLDSLERIGQNIAGEYLTWEGQARAFKGGVLDKLGRQGPAVEFNAQRGAALQEVEQFFNQYRKEITGAAAAEQELKALKKAVINTDVGPAEFQARYSALIKKLRDGLTRKQGILGQDIIKPDDPAMTFEYLGAE